MHAGALWSGGFEALETSRKMMFAFCGVGGLCLYRRLEKQPFASKNLIDLKGKSIAMPENLKLTFIFGQ